jgi:hypothetical protein
MVFLYELPLEIFLYIRNYLYHVDNNILALADRNDDLFEEKFMTHEAKWSWRNFLSSSRNPNWQEIRKQIMIFSLNKYETRKYLTNADFRSCVNRLVAFPAKQVELSVASHTFSYYSFSNKTLELNPAVRIHLSFYSEEKCLPRCPFLQALIISGGIKITRLMDLPNLTALHLTGDSYVAGTVCIDLPQLSVLRIDCPVNDDTFSLFPLEQVKELSFACHIHTDLSKFLPRWKTLNSLEVNNSLETETDVPILPKLPIPSLQSLSVSNFESIDVSGLFQLKKLKIEGVQQIHGLSDILPSLTYCSLALWDVNPLLNDILTRSKDTLRVSLRGSFHKRAPFTVHSKIRSLQIDTNILSVREVPPTRYFDFVSLCCPSFTDISMFRTVQHLVLDNCSNLTDIRSICHIPYLRIDYCPNIEDLSCLGSQHCLILSHMFNLKNSDIERFGNIHCLKLYKCSGITEVQNLWNNRFVGISYCDGLQTILLEGNDYVKVAIESCLQLNQLQVLGKVYCLKLVDCGKVDTNYLEQYRDKIAVKNWDEEWEEQYEH